MILPLPTESSARSEFSTSPEPMSSVFTSPSTMSELKTVLAA
jgi:hypothetical protein